MTRVMVAISLLTLCLGALSSQAYAQAANASDKLSQADLEEMLGPIALYPDPLLANALAASVYPAEVTKAAQFIKQGGKTEDASKQSWEQPVKLIAEVPDVLNLLADNIDWTTAIGQAYMLQPGDVSGAIQALRTKAYSNGALQSNDQQTVVQEGDTVVIESANPEYIYVPQYDPGVVYSDSYYGWGTVATGAIGFGAGILAGAAWNNIHWDWGDGHMSWGNWNGDANFNRNINRGDINVDRPRPGDDGRPWNPNRDKVNPLRPGNDKLGQFKGDRGREAMKNLNRPSQLPAGPGVGRPGGPGVRPGGGVAPSVQPLKKVSPPTRLPSNLPNMARPGGGAARPSTPGVRPGGGTARPSTPIARPGGGTPSRSPSVAPRPSGNPSAFNRTGSSSASRNRGSVSRAPSGGRSSGVSRGGGGGRGGGRGGGGRGGGRR